MPFLFGSNSAALSSIADRSDRSAAFIQFVEGKVVAPKEEPGRDFLWGPARLRSAGPAGRTPPSRPFRIPPDCTTKFRANGLNPVVDSALLTTTRRGLTMSF